MGGGGLVTLTTIIITDMTTVRERPKFLTYMVFPYALGNLGLVIGSAIGQNTTWRW
jgi:hypothetical protein